MRQSIEIKGSLPLAEEVSGWWTVAPSRAGDERRAAPGQRLVGLMRAWFEVGSEYSVKASKVGSLAASSVQYVYKGVCHKSLPDSL